MNPMDIIFGGLGLIASASLTFCAWYMKKIVVDIEQIKVMLAGHSEIIELIKEKNIL